MRKRYFHVPVQDYVHAGASVAQSIASAATVKLTNLVHLAGDGMTWDSSADNVRLNGAGLYTFIAEVTFAANVTGQRGVHVFFNGLAFFDERTIANNTAAAVHHMMVKRTYQLLGVQGNALIDVRAFQSSGVALNVNSATLTILKQRNL